MNRHPMTRKQVVTEIQRAWKERLVLRDASLVGVDLRGLNLWGADLTGADLTGADLSNVFASGATFDHADLSLANCSGATFQGASFVGARLIKTNLSLANLQKSSLRDAHLQEVRCFGAYFYGTILPSGGLPELVGVNFATFRRRTVEPQPAQPRVRPQTQREGLRSSSIQTEDETRRRTPYGRTSERPTGRGGLTPS